MATEKRRSISSSPWSSKSKQQQYEWLSSCTLARASSGTSDHHAAQCVTTLHTGTPGKLYCTGDTRHSVAPAARPADDAVTAIIAKSSSLSSTFSLLKSQKTQRKTTQNNNTIAMPCSIACHAMNNANRRSEVCAIQHARSNI